MSLGGCFTIANGVSRMEWSRMEWSRMEWSRMEWSRMEWSRMERSEPSIIIIDDQIFIYYSA